MYYLFLDQLKIYLKNRFRDITLKNSFKTNFNVFKRNIDDDLFLQYMKNIRNQGVTFKTGASYTNPFTGTTFKPNKKFTEDYMVQEGGKQIS